MSCKLSLNNSFKANCDSVHWIKTPSSDGNVKFAGDEAKDRLYEPKHKKKLVRVLTVVAYIFFVSLAAIMLSLYYVFIWNGNQKDNTRLKTVVVSYTSKCDEDNLRLAIPSQPSIEYPDDVSLSIPTETNLTWEAESSGLDSDGENLTEFTKDSFLLQKLFEDKI